MENDRNPNPDLENTEQQEKKQQSGVQFNSGNNESDYDGGHPGDGFSEEAEQESEKSEEKNSFNAGNNDSDYDGGHPGDSPPSKK